MFPILNIYCKRRVRAYKRLILINITISTHYKGTLKQRNPTKHIIYDVKWKL